MAEKLLILTPMVLLVLLQAGVDAQRYYNYGGNLYEHGRSISDNQVSCGPYTCGVGAHCIHGSVRPVCACLAGYSGDPLSQCRNTRKTRRTRKTRKSGCLNNSDCRSDQSCVMPQCVNPCKGTCGFNANCDVVNHFPLCSCPAGYTGNPFVACSLANPGYNGEALVNDYESRRQQAP